MLQGVRRIIPQFIKNGIRVIIRSFLEPLQKKILIKKMGRKHQQLLVEIKGKEKVKVVFLELFKGMWKLDPIFIKMLEDPSFEPIILVCPCVSYSEDAMWEGMRGIYTFFKNKNYPVMSAYVAAEQRWMSLQEINPDLVFFSIPHNMTRKEYYEDAYLNYLSCFCGYGYIISEMGNKVPNFDQPLHNALWRNFATDEYAYSGFKKYSTIRGCNTILTGYPALEYLISNPEKICVWKTQDTRKKIIFAPHHTIENVSGFKLSNFLEHAEFFRELALKYKDEVVWCFKPHPELKMKLYKHSDWGVERTNSYYQFWENQENTQRNDGEYTNLFLGSDAMIHDSGTFLVEYLMHKKPVLYLVSKDTQNTLSPLAIRALAACAQASRQDQIEHFVADLIAGTARVKDEHLSFYQQEFIPLYHENSPSSTIMQEIKQHIRH